MQPTNGPSPVNETSPHMDSSRFLRAQLKVLLDAHYDRRSKTVGGVVNSPELQEAELKAFEEFSFALNNYVESNDISSISVLRLDGDLYHSTMTPLIYLWPKVSPGGIEFFRRTLYYC